MVIPEKHSHVVYGVDVGVYHRGQTGEPLATTTTGWARLDAVTGPLNGVEYCKPGENGTGQFTGSNGAIGATGKSIPQLAGLMVKDLRESKPVALVFEAPMWLPVSTTGPAAGESLFGPRFCAEKGDGAKKRYEWYRQAGAAAALKALSLGVWLFSEVRLEQPHQEWTLRPEVWMEGSVQLLLAESFVAGDYKYKAPSSCASCPDDQWDAFISAAALRSVELGEPVGPGAKAERLFDEACDSEAVISLWHLIMGKAGFPATSEKEGACAVYGIRSPAA